MAPLREDIRFLSVAEVRHIHQRQLELFGGIDGVRDEAALASAVATPQAAFDGAFVHDSLPAIAAAYLFHLARNHPFLDGNKRTALASMLTFLALNGHGFAASHDEAERLTQGVASGDVTKPQLTRVVTQRTRPDRR